MFTGSVSLYSNLFFRLFCWFFQYILAYLFQCRRGILSFTFIKNQQTTLKLALKILLQETGTMVLRDKVQ